MAVLSDRDKEKVRKTFEERLKEPVSIQLFTQHESPLVLPGHECATCRETRELLEEVAGLSDKISLEVKDFLTDRQEAESMGIERIPAILLDGQVKGRVRFFGAPSGYEFSVLLQDILDASSGELGLSEDTLRKLSELQEDLHIQVFTTPT